MTTIKKGRNGGNRAALKTTIRHHHSATTSRFKALIVDAALWGLLPVKLADWIIRRLHLGGA